MLLQMINRNIEKSDFTQHQTKEKRPKISDAVTNL